MRIAYWIVTVLAAIGLLLGGIGQLMPVTDALVAGDLTAANPNSPSDGLFLLGYPLYFAKILAFWKFAGVLTLLVPGFARLKEWAYAGFVVLLTGAIISHVVVEGTYANAIPATILLVLVLVSYVLRPEDRKLAPAGT